MIMLLIYDSGSEEFIRRLAERPDGTTTMPILQPAFFIVIG
jgi:hypothetical protein